jgi:hypothetical protein
VAVILENLLVVTIGGFLRLTVACKNLAKALRGDEVRSFALEFLFGAAGREPGQL